MALSRLKVSAFRNIEEADLHFHPRLNLIEGENGAGKTSILEAISVLGLGKSFRTRHHGNLVQDGLPLYSLYGEVGFEQDNHVKVGIEKGKGVSTVKINGESVFRSADLAYLLPLQVVNSESFSLLDGGPSERRRFLDWMVFHVKHDYGDLWSRAHRCIRQRNALLKKKDITSEDLEVWDQQLIPLSEEIAAQRATVFAAFVELVSAFLGDVVTACKVMDRERLGTAIDLDLDAGWSVNEGYDSVLESAFSGDRKIGFTRYGVHKADILFSFGQRSLADVFSRGQQKLFISALCVAQLRFFMAEKGRGCLLIFDDLPAEMDNKNIERFFNWVKELKDIQLFITGIDLHDIGRRWHDSQGGDFKMFHVKQGQIKEKHCEWSKP